ncbi:MAG: transcription antitermination factor NusB [Verrucomicrobiae bacterium]|nr:transcription antitermination factor NusB [Verrucomicrobiae bacterium]NNJ86637.1 transcription antitermination factor NusB [Akkermansiaceae bacterium]
MLKRRNIRETAIQFLYFADLEDGPAAFEMQEAFWQMTQESSLHKLEKAKAKAMLHVAQGREHRVAKLDSRAATAEAELKASADCAPLASALKKIRTRENKLTSATQALQTTLKQKKPDVSLSKEMDDVFQANRSIAALRRDWHESLEDFPLWKNKLEPVTAAIRQLERVSERLDAIDDPESIVGDFAHLRAGSAEITAFREETQALVQNIIQHKKSLDASLASVVENYSPERVDPVDKAILRLASYEIEYCDDIPRAVSINEAIEIAKKFGTTESARFINGVLDAVGK